MRRNLGGSSRINSGIGTNDEHAGRTTASQGSAVKQSIAETGPWRRRLLFALFWAGLAALMWTLDTLTQIEVLDRLDFDYRLDLLVVSQATSAIGVLVMVPFVIWLLGHFPIRRGALWQTLLGHVGGSIVFSIGHYAVMILLRKMSFPLFGANYGDPASLVGNLVFEYQKDVKIYLAVVIIVTVYRQFLGGEKRLQLRPK